MTAEWPARTRRITARRATTESSVLAVLLSALVASLAWAPPARADIPPSGPGRPSDWQEYPAPKPAPPPEKEDLLAALLAALLLSAALAAARRRQSLPHVSERGGRAR
jgi:hypothetical protein